MPSDLDPDRQWWRLAPAVFCLAWGGNQFTPMLAMYRDLEGYSATTVNLLLAMYVVGLVPGFQIAGPASRRLGPARCTYAGLGLAGASSLLLAVGSGSPLLMAAARFLVGLSVAVAMVVGTTWIAELTDAPADDPAAARRTATTLTLGFGLGAGVAGSLSQWAPAPRVLPYVVHLGLVILAAAALRRAKGGPPRVGGRADRVDLRLPRAARSRFLLVVLPTAPWVFAAAGLAYAIVPELVAGSTGDLSVAFATLLTVLTLGAGAAVQQWVPALQAVTGGRAVLVGMGLMTVGVALAATEVSVRSVAVAVLTALVLGTAYGITIVAGLVEIRRIAVDEGLPGLVGIFYALTYLGFALPVVLAAVQPWVGYGWTLSAVAATCLACGGVTVLGLARTAGPVRTPASTVPS